MEFAWFDKLRAYASNWHEAHRFRSYLAVIRGSIIKKSSVIQPGSEFEKWLIWAEELADLPDTATKSPPLILDEQDA